MSKTINNNTIPESMNTADKARLYSDCLEAVASTIAYICPTYFNGGNLAGVKNIDTEGSISCTLGLDVGTNTLVVNPTSNRVGINNNAPGYSLDIAGTLRATGNTIFGGTISAAGALSAAGITDASLLSASLVGTDATGKLVSASAPSSDITHNGTTSKQGGNGVDEYYHVPLLTDKQIAYSNSSGVITSDNGLTYNGTDLSVGGDINVADGALISNGTAGITLGNGTLGSLVGDISLDSGSSGNFNVYRGGVSRLNIGTYTSVLDSSGNVKIRLVNSTGYVGINENNPQAQLDVDGGIIATGDVAIDTDTLFVDVSKDMVGINNSSPAEALDVVGNGAFTTKDGIATLSIERDNTTSTPVDGQVHSLLNFKGDYNGSKNLFQLGSRVNFDGDYDLEFFVKDKDDNVLTGLQYDVDGCTSSLFSCQKLAASQITASATIKANSNLEVAGVTTINSSAVFFSSLPTTDPASVGRVWNNSGVLTVSAG